MAEPGESEKTWKPSTHDKTGTSGRNTSHRHWNCWLSHSSCTTNSALGEGFRNWDRQGKEGFVRDCKGMPVPIKSHSMMRARSKSCFWGSWEMERTVQPTGQGKKWGIRRKFRLGIGDACLMPHWDYHQGCRCPWWCYEYPRLGIRRVRGKVIFPGTQCSLRNVPFRDHCLQSYGFDQEGDHQRGLQLFLLALGISLIPATSPIFLLIPSFCSMSKYGSRCHFFSLVFNHINHLISTLDHFTVF